MIEEHKIEEKLIEEQKSSSPAPKTPWTLKQVLKSDLVKEVKNFVFTMNSKGELCLENEDHAWFPIRW